MKTRIVYTKIWEDDFFLKLSKSGKLLFLYIITNSRINMTGLYELTDRTLHFDTGLTKNELTNAKKELAPKVFFHKNWVNVVNAMKLGGYRGNLHDKGIRTEMKLIPIEIRRYFEDKIKANF